MKNSSGVLRTLFDGGARNPAWQPNSPECASVLSLTRRAGALYNILDSQDPFLEEVIIHDISERTTLAARPGTGADAHDAADGLHPACSGGGLAAAVRYPELDGRGGEPRIRHGSPGQLERGSGLLGARHAGGPGPGHDPVGDGSQRAVHLYHAHRRCADGCVRRGHHHRRYHSARGDHRL